MKKKLVLILTALAVLLADHVFAAEEKGPEVEIYNYEGHTNIVRDGRAVAMDFDFPCNTGDLLKADLDSTIDLSLHSLVGVRFFGPAECVLSDIQASNVYLTLNFGNAMVNMKPLPRDTTFKIETPTVVVTSNKAQFFVKISKQEENSTSTTVTVKNGLVDVLVKSSASTVSLREGLSVDVSPETYIPAARNATEGELKPLERVLSIYIVEPIVEES